MAVIFVGFTTGKTSGDNIAVPVGTNRVVVITHRQQGTVKAVTGMTFGGLAMTLGVAKTEGNSYNCFYYYAIPDSVAAGNYPIVIAGPTSAPFAVFSLKDCASVKSGAWSGGSAGIGNYWLNDVVVKADGITITQCALADNNGGVHCETTGYTTEDEIALRYGISHRLPTVDTTETIIWDWDSTTTASVIAITFDVYSGSPAETSNRKSVAGVASPKSVAGVASANIKSVIGVT